MKQKLFTTAKTAVAIALFAATVATVSAWTAPAATAPGGNVPAPVNTGNVAQTKNANLSLVGNLNAHRGFFSTLVNGPKAVFGCLVFCDSNNDTNVFTAGKFNTGIFGGGLQVAANGGTLIGEAINAATGNGNGVVVDPSGAFSVGKRLSWFVQGLIVAPTTGKVTVTGPLAITSGSPAAGKVLVSTDSNGNAVWGDGLGDTVDTSGDLIKYVSVVDNDTGMPRINYAYCPSGYFPIGGGGDCQKGFIDVSQPIVSSNGNSFNPGAEENSSTGGSAPYAPFTSSMRGWMIKCSAPNATDDPGDGDIHVDVICMKNTQIAGAVASSGTTPPSGGGGGNTTPPYVVDWKPLASAPNVPGQAALGASCSTWLAGSTYATKPKRAQGTLVTTPGLSFTLGTDPDAQGGTESCVYQLTSSMYQQGYTFTSTMPASGNYVKSTCAFLPPGTSRADARPVKTCTDTQSTIRLGTGTESGTYTINTEVKY